MSYDRGHVPPVMPPVMPSAMPPVMVHHPKSEHSIGDMTPGRQGLDFLLDHHGRNRPSLNGIDHLTHDSATYGRSVLQTAVPLSSTSRMHPLQALLPIKYGPYTAVPMHCPPTCPLDHVFGDFITARRAQIKHAPSTIPIVLGPNKPSYSVLVNPQISPHSHPLSKLHTDILDTFPDISRLAERVAILYHQFNYMRWQIHPTRENYDMIPSWLVPSERSTTQAHPAWIDHLCWPEMRELIVADHTAMTLAQEKSGERGSDASAAVAYPFEDFFIPFTTTCSVNWTRPNSEVLVRNPAWAHRATSSTPTGPEALDEWLINPLFEEHCRKLESWSLGPAFAAAWPRLVGTFRLVE